MRCQSQRTVLKSSFSLYGDTSPKGVLVNTLTNRLFWRLRTKKWVRGSWPIKIMSICTVRCHFQLNQALWLVRKELGKRSNSKSAEKATWIYLPQCLVSLSFFWIAPRRKQKNQGRGTVFLPHKTLWDWKLWISIWQNYQILLYIVAESKAWLKGTQPKPVT